MDFEDLRIKYRARTFEGLLGNKFLKKNLISRIQTKAFPTGLAFAGFGGTGKSISARLLVKGTNCQDFDGDCCDQCPNCLRMEERFPEWPMGFGENYDCPNITERQFEAIINRIGWGLGINEREIHVFDEFQNAKFSMQERFHQILATKSDCLFVFCLIDIKFLHEPFRQRVEILHTSRPEIDEIVPWLRHICEAENISIKDYQALNEIATISKRILRECLTILQTVLTMEQPLTLSLVRDVYNSRTLCD